MNYVGMTSAALASRLRSAHAAENCTDLNQVVARAEQSISEIAGRSAGVQFALSPNVKFVAVPLPQLEQLVLGLCSAARTLLGHTGRIVVETRGINDAPIGPSHSVVQTTEARARLVVRVEQQRMESADEPDWQSSASTQAEVPLSELEQLLKRVGGRLEIVPLSERDLAYVAHLPYAIGTDASGRMAIAVPQQSGVILLIEDEPQVQAVTTRILRAFGYSVITAHNERSALAQAEVYGSAIGLVVSDLVLPGVSGKDLVRRLRHVCEQAQVLYISGYSPEHVGPLSDGARFLRKPFTAQELLGVVRELLPEAAVAR
ncbi:MAG TPA: response regulator [Polyangiaceae bacterium]|nr:response regulator [Polyangiaceae bacterium]